MTIEPVPTNLRPMSPTEDKHKKVTKQVGVLTATGAENMFIHFHSLILEHARLTTGIEIRMRK